MSDEHGGAKDWPHDRVYDWIRKIPGVKPVRADILARIVRRSQLGKPCFESNEVMAKSLQIDVRTLQRNLDWLEDEDQGLLLNEQLKRGRQLILTPKFWSYAPPDEGENQRRQNATQQSQRWHFAATTRRFARLWWHNATLRVFKRDKKNNKTDTLF